MENVSGSVIKGYELRERIGSGGFGAVYRAYQSTVGREVAVKIILPHFANQPDFIRRFETEAQLVARLEHPYIIPLYDYWRDPDGAYLVMRWLRGGSLRDALKDRPFDLETAVLFMDQVTAALSVAHRNQVVHRDLKPPNILMDEDGNAYLADFGIAKDLGNLANGATAASAIVGSPDYLSPEQARSELVTPQTDIYSLGVVLYEALTGQHPFPNATPVERLYKHLNEMLPPIPNLSPEITDSVNAVIARATAKNPAHRYSDVLAMAAAFREAVGMSRARVGETVVETLTQREQEILQRIMSGQSNKQMAQELFVTMATVKWYIRQIYGKLHVRSRVQAIVRARELRLITSGSTPGASAPMNGATVTPIDDIALRNPYKGLLAFQTADSRDFFGREKLTQKLMKRLGDVGAQRAAPLQDRGEPDFPRFLAVVGPSGSGKSSLIKAGLIPALWRGELPGSERWFIVEMIPGAHPLDELEIALTRVAANQTGSLREQLERDERGLVRVAQLILPNDGSELVLVIDQFEEVFTLLEDETARDRFLKMLYAAVTDPRSRVRVVMTLRADFYDRPLRYSDFGELVRSRMETILPLSAEELERAIARPVEQAGVSFEPGLVASIVGEVNYQPGALPLLQYALTELFEQRQGRTLTHEAYQAIGGTVGALAKRAEEIYGELTPEGQEAARQMFLRLVTLGEGVEDTRRRAARSELMAVAADEELMDEIVDTYAAYRLLSLDNDPGTRMPTVEVAHEAILREWGRLRGWLNESRDEIRWQRQLAHAANEWHEANQESSFLLRGSRLEQLEKWAADTGLALTADERAYLDASLSERERQADVEKDRQARESHLERRSVTFLRALVAVLLLAVLGAFGLTGFAVNQSQIALRNAAEAQNVALVAGSQAALATGNTDLAIALAMNAVNLNPTSAPAEVALGQAAYAPGTVRRFVGHSRGVRGVAFSSDEHMAVSGGDDGTLILWDVATGQIIRQFTGGHTQGITRVTFSPDGRTILSSADDGLIVLWDVATGAIIRRFEGHTGWAPSVEFSPDGRTALSCGQDKTVILWDVATGAIIRRFTGHTDSVQAVVFSADGRTAWSGSDDKTFILWDLATGTVLRQLSNNTGIWSIDLSPDNRYALTTGSSNALIYLWDLTTGQAIRSFQGHTGQVDDAKFSPDGKHILSGSEDGTLILWDLETGQIVERLAGHAGGIRQVVFTLDGRYALSSSRDQTVRLWDLGEGYIIRRFAGHGGYINALLISHDGQTALTASWDGTASLWDLQTGRELHHLTEPTQLQDVSYSPDGHTALIAEGNLSGASLPGLILLWDVGTGQIIRRFESQKPVTAVAFSPDGETFLSSALDGTVFLWDINTGQITRRFTTQPTITTRLAFSQDGRTAMTGAIDGGIILWDVETGQPIRSFVGQTDIVISIEFNQDNRTVLSAGTANGANLWDIATGRLIRHFDGGAVFSPDGRTIFGGSGSTLGTNSAVLIDLATGNLIRHFTGFRGTPSRSEFTADGRSALVGFSDGKLELWRIDTLDELIAWTQANRYIPELTCDQRALYRLEPLCSVS